MRRLSAYVGVSLGALVLAVAVLIFGFGGAILNGYGKEKAERAFAEAHPGYALRIGALEYAVGANRLVGGDCGGLHCDGVGRLSGCQE
jgi:hypothetical protein